jgi:hypothetical protein
MDSVDDATNHSSLGDKAGLIRKARVNVRVADIHELIG